MLKRCTFSYCNTVKWRTTYFLKLQLNALLQCRLLYYSKVKPFYTNWKPTKCNLPLTLRLFPNPSTVSTKTKHTKVCKYRSISWHLSCLTTKFMNIIPHVHTVYERNYVIPFPTALLSIEKCVRWLVYALILE